MCKSKYLCAIDKSLLCFIIINICTIAPAFAQIEDPISEGPREVPIPHRTDEHSPIRTQDPAPVTTQERTPDRAQERTPVRVEQSASTSTEKQVSPVKPRRINVGYGISAISFPFPFRRGPHVSYAISPQVELGAQYMKDRLNFRLGGMRFGGAEESFWLVQGRWFPLQRFNMSFGLGERKVRFNFLSKQLATLIRQDSASHHIDINNVVADLGFSHRWVTKTGLTFQADWLSITVPVASSRVSGAPIDAIVDERVRNGTKRAASILGRTPSVALLGASAGWSF